ncbi:MAG TPA: hypothetical protein VFS56_11165 [Gemmatimonadaceae bacterium]|nr:hypothetical protein [Gemmatimonadaceae bacterium]
MHNARFRLMAGLAGATLSLFAVTSYGQTPATTEGDYSSQTTAQPTPPVTPEPSGTATDPITPGTQTDIVTTTETTTWSFPGGIWGILAVGALAILILFALFRGRDTTVVKETYTTAGTAPGTRTVSTGTAVDDRTLTPRAASGTEPGTRGGMSDPNTRL